MKNLLLLILITGAFSTYGQNFNNTKAVSVTAELIETQGENYKVRSGDINIDEKKKIVEYTRDVVFITDQITLEADKIVYNHNTKEVVATGNFRAKGVTMEFKTGTKPSTLRYKLGETVAYLE